jgi:hypothetical protein
MLVTRGVRLCSWPATSPAREDVSDIRFRRCFYQWLRLFLLYIVVWSKHNFDNFYFWAKIKHHFKPSALYQLLGIPTPSCADRWCTDSCLKEAKHTETQYLTWFDKFPTSTGEVNIIRDIEKGLQHTWRRRITSLKLYSQLSHTAACGSPSFFLVLFTFLQPSLILLSLSLYAYL